MFEMRGMWDDSGEGWEAHVHEEGAQRYCFGGKGGGSNTTTSVQLPPEIAAAASENFAMAKGIAAQPYQGYNGERVAGFSNDQLGMQQGVRNMQGFGQQVGNTAMGMTAHDANFGARQVNTNFNAMMTGAQSMPGQNMDAYLSPYLGQVRDTGLAAIEQSRQQALNQTSDRAISAGAFGGSRDGIQRAVSDAQYGAKAAEFAANVGNQGWQQASQMMTSDMNRNLQSQMGNQSAWQANNALNQNGQATNAQLAAQAAQIRLGAANQYANIGNLSQQMTGRELSLLDASGQQQQALTQAGNDNAYSQWLEKYNWDSGQTPLGIRESALGMMPYGQNSSSSTSGGGGSAVGAAAGGVMAGATIASALSDPKTKRDMKRMGTDEQSGLGIYAFRYADDAKTAPKQLGLDAREVAKKYPEASTKFSDDKGGETYGLLFNELPESVKPIVSGKANSVPMKKGKR